MPLKWRASVLDYTTKHARRRGRIQLRESKLAGEKSGQPEKVSGVSRYRAGISYSAEISPGCLLSSLTSSTASEESLLRALEG